MLRTRWRRIPGYPRYLVSSTGQVLTQGTHTSKAGILKTAPVGQMAYPGVTLYDGSGGRRTYPVHVLVLLAFVGPRPDGAVGRHKDGNVANNHESNLCWGTQTDNMQDAVQHGSVRHGARHGHAKLTEEQAREVKNRSDVGVYELARLYGISVRTAYSIRRGETWKYLV